MIVYYTFTTFLSIAVDTVNIVDTAITLYSIVTFTVAMIYIVRSLGGGTSIPRSREWLLLLLLWYNTSIILFRMYTFLLQFTCSFLTYLTWCSSLTWCWILVIAQKDQNGVDCVGVWMGAGSRWGVLGLGLS